VPILSAWTLHLGDCLDPVTGLATLPDKSVDHVICDPPYEAEAHTKARRTTSSKWRNTNGHGKAVDDYEIDFKPITDADRCLAASHMARVSAGWVLVFCQVEAVDNWRLALKVAGASWRRAVAWVKPDGTPQLTGDRPAQAFECVACAWAGDGRSKWNGGGKRGIYTHCVNDFGRLERLHPTTKPEALMCDLVLDFTQPDQTVLDPFAGSGTTGVAAIRNGRRFIGWEKDPRYHEIARKRLEGTKEQLVLGGPRVKAKQESLL
jgi:site-specific DNA-methyltransferase (adenine-specific)